MDLTALRARIDALDTDLIRLLNERAQLVHQVGEVKRAEGLEIYAPQREEQLLNALAAKNHAQGGLLPALGLRAIYREIMSASLALEKDLAIAYFGGDAERAARSKFGASVRYVAQPGVAEVFDAVARGRADYGVALIENSTEGAINPTLDTFIDSPLRICAQITLEAAAARFLVIGARDCPATGQDRTSLVFGVPDEAGALFAALEPLQTGGVNMSKIERRPSPRQPGEQVFFVDVEGHREEGKIGHALAALEKRCTFVKILGSYPSGVGTG